jgi:hypothetical protein
MIAKRKTFRRSKYVAYIFQNCWENHNQHGEVVWFVDYWIVDKLVNLISGEYRFERQFWSMVLNDGHKEKFLLTAE